MIASILREQNRPDLLGGELGLLNVHFVDDPKIYRFGPTAILGVLYFSTLFFIVLASSTISEQFFKTISHTLIFLSYSLAKVSVSEVVDGLKSKGLLFRGSRA